MSAVEVTITGMLYDRMNRTAQNVVLIGEATLTNVGVGGGPVIPPGGGGEGGKPPGIWPSPGRPAHPIAPGGRPGWGSPVDPDYGIEGPSIPPEPSEPPPGGGDKPPPEDAGGWGYVAEWSRWGYFPASGDKPHPPSVPRPPGTPDNELPPEPPSPQPTQARSGLRRT